MTYVYAFDHRHQMPLSEVKALIGGKAANLAVMATELGLPVPPAFTISTAACNTYLAGGWPDGLEDEIRRHMVRMEQLVGRRFGDPADPLLVSVRSGAPISMPGMMDTILNLGLNDATETGLAAVSGDPAFAADCHARFRHVYRDIVGVADVPDDPWAQLRGAVEAVFRSWNSDRARAYRAHEGISDSLGTAVTVQTMVFGNRGSDSGTGVLFTRNPATGENGLYGDVMFNAQGEDVVAGTHQTEPISCLDTRMPAVGAELSRYAEALERHYADLCDIEFTIERGKLWMLQVRVGKRSPQAALRIALEMAESADFPVSRAEAVRRVAHLLVCPPTITTERIDVGAPLTSGLAASPGVACGEIAMTPEAAVEAADAGRRVILVRAETSPDDVHGMARAAGILTSSGGLASHAAVVARGWGIPAVVGAAAVELGDGTVTIGDRTLVAGEQITIDGGTGEVFAGVAGGVTEVVPEAARLLAWAREAGIEIGGAASEAAPPEPADGAVEAKADLAADVASADGLTQDDVVRGLVVKGLAALDGLLATVQATSDQAQPVLDELIGAGLVDGSSGFYKLTAPGKLRGSELIAADQGQWGLDNAAAALDQFVELDRRVKAIVTAWQMRDVDGTQVLNAHDDPEYDRSVVDQLVALHTDASAWLRPLEARLARLGMYHDRLERALQVAREGDGRFVASPRVDSYHSVWFELHEDLINLAGRTRAEEAAAGRA